jgi:hypothetical protein
LVDGVEGLADLLAYGGILAGMGPRLRGQGLRGRCCDQRHSNCAQNDPAHDFSSNLKAAKQGCFVRRAEDLPLEEGPDNLRETRKTIQRKRTIVRSNLGSAMPIESARGAQ